MIAVGPDNDMEAVRALIAAGIKANDSGDGVVIVTDLFGGMPSNLAISLMDERVEVIAGMNLPILIRLSSVRDHALREAAHTARDTGRRYISNAREVLQQDDADSPASGEPFRNGDGRLAELKALLRPLAGDVEELRRLLRAAAPTRTMPAQMGHNLPPPPYTIEDDATLAEGAVAIRTAEVALAAASPAPDALHLCYLVLKRVLKLLRKIRRWSLTKADLLPTEGAKSIGKALGPALLASGIAAGLRGRSARSSITCARCWGSDVCLP